MKKVLWLLVLVLILLIIIAFGWMGLGGKKIPEMKPTVETKVVAPVKKAVTKVMPAKKAVKKPAGKIIPRKK
jgi:hypothetical protein